MGELSSIRTISRSSEEGTSVSGREVNKCKKLILKKEREERRNNIVIKRLTIMEEEGDKKEKVKEWLYRKIGVECNIVWCKNNDMVLVARIGN